MQKDEGAAMKMVVASIVLFTAATGCRREPSAPSAGSSPSPFTIRALTAERSGDHLHLTVTVLAKNPGSAPLLLAPPAVRLWIGRDKTAAPFIAPGLEPAAIAPGVESEGTTHWWLTGADLSGPLELEIGGARQTVKTSDAFISGSLAEGQPMPLSFPVWKAIPVQ